MAVTRLRVQSSPIRQTCGKHRTISLQGTRGVMLTCKTQRRYGRNDLVSDVVSVYMHSCAFMWLRHFCLFRRAFGLPLWGHFTKYRAIISYINYRLHSLLFLQSNHHPLTLHVCIVQLQELYSLLYENYVEDSDSVFRFDYSKEFLLWCVSGSGDDGVVVVGWLIFKCHLGYVKYFLFHSRARSLALSA